MNTVRPLSIALAVSLLAMLLLGGPLPATAAPTWTVSQLTTDASRHIQPSVSAGRVIWLAADGAIYRVFTQKLGVDTSPVVVTTGGATDANWPKVSGDRILWQEDYAGEFNIYTRKMGTDASPVLVSADSPSYNIWPELSGDRAVWYGSTQIFTRKMGADASWTQLTDMSPVTDSVQVSGDRVVWTAHVGSYEQVFTQKVGIDDTPIQLTTQWDQLSPKVDGDRIVWLGYTNGYKQVFTRKMGVDASPVQLTNYPYSDAAAPDVSGDRIVWTNNERVFTQKMGVDAQPVQLSSADAGIAKVSGDRVIWLESDGSNYQLIVQDVGSGDEPVQLSTNGGGQPQISGEYVTWVSNVDGFEQVFVAHAMVTPVNDAPTAMADSRTTSEDTALTVAAPGVLANDTDANGDVLTASLVTSVSHGTLALSANGSFTYTPTADYSGTDSFTYRAFDGVAYSSAATVSIAVRASTCVLTYAAGTGGIISGSSPQTVNYNGSGTAVTAISNDGYHFVSWSDGVLTAMRTDRNVTANVSVTANFAADASTTRTLAYTPGPGGTVSGTLLQTVLLGGSGSPVAAVPNAGYHFVNWSDGVTTATRTDSIVTADKSVTANFAVNAVETRTLSYLAGTGGTIAGITPQTVSVGGSGSAVTAVPNIGYHFVAWSDGGLDTVRQDMNVTANHTISATFAADTVVPPAKTYTALSFKATPTTSYSGHKFVFSGKISPSSMASGTRITIWWRKSGQPWRKLGTVYTNVYDNYSYTLYNGSRAHGTYYVRAKYAGNSVYASSYSPYKKVYIR